MHRKHLEEMNEAASTDPAWCDELPAKERKNDDTRNHNEKNKPNPSMTQGREWQRGGDLAAARW
jgi:hypothetical protein